MMAVVMAGTTIAGCVDPPGSIGATELAAIQVDAYRLKPGDRLKVTVFDEPELTGEFQVGDNGTIGFPLVGTVQAGGISADELRGNLVNQLRQGFVKNPRVTIDVINYRPFNVIGEVRNAGQYAYRPGLTVQDAIAMAGGYTYRANTGTVYVRHSDGADEVAVRTGAERRSILPGDNIRVPERYF